jgi:hypothetical protein
MANSDQKSSSTKSTTSQKWLLVAVNPWYRWLYNPATGETKHEKK